MIRHKLLTAIVILLAIPAMLTLGYRCQQGHGWQETEAFCLQKIQLDRGQTGWWICYEGDQGCEERLVFPPQPHNLLAGASLTIQYRPQGERIRISPTYIDLAGP
ncbi:MAG: hypothetical protein AAFV07_02100 [Bacteroidota bacterium]